MAYEVTASGDFGVTTGADTATFLANSSTTQVRVPTTDDTTHEAHGSVTLTLTANPVAYDLGTEDTVTATVRDNDDSPATGAVTITGTAMEGETLTADTSGITDADGLDSAAYAYQWVRTPSGGSDADISGATSKTYVPVFADAGATLKVRVTVTDDEGHQAMFESAPTAAVAALPRPSVTVASDGDVTEGDTVTFTLIRTGDTVQTLDVAYTLTATGDFGVTPGAGTATFLANSATVQANVATTDDSTHEAHGSVTLTLTANPVAYDLGSEDAATATVLDNDDSPATGAVTITGTAMEGETLTADTSGITDADGLDNAAYAYQWVRTPSGGSDADISGATGATYVPVFADASATLKVRVTVTDDEGHQAMFESAPTTAVAALPRPSVTVASDGDVTEGSAAMFTLTRTGDTAQTLDVAYALTASGDFGVTPLSGTATFLANSSTVQVTVTTTDDTTHEAHGSVTLMLTANPVAYDLGTEDAATAAIRDNDDSPATGAVTIMGTPTEGETLTADTSGITDADGLDNAAYAYQWVRTPSGGSDADISGATGATYVPVFADASATLKVRVTVTDDEGHQAMFESAPTTAVVALPRPSVPVVSDGDVTEGDTVTFTLTRTGDTAGTLDVAYETTASGDFGVTTGAGTATFLANSSTTQVSVDTTDDTTHETHGSVTMTLTANPVAYDLETENTATAAVRDNDDSPATGAVTITGTPTEGETLTANTSGIIDADGLDSAAYVYQWVRTPSGGGDADISGATSKTYVAVFADADATLKVKVTVTDDEGHQAMFESAPTTAVAALPRPSVTVVSDGDVTEGDTVTFTLTRTGDTAQTLDMAYETTTTGDFGVTTGADTATFLANSSTVQVSVDTTDDSAHEAHGSVTLMLTANPVAYDLGTEDAATAAIRDNDDSPATGSVTITGTPTEGETLTADTSGITDADGLDNAAWAYQWMRTPPGGSDADISGATSKTYVPVFADAGTTLKIRVTVTDDERHQATFTSAPTAVVTALPRPEVDELTMTLSVSPEVVSEGAGETPVMVTVTATGSTRMGETRTVTVSVMDSGEEAAVDYAAIKDFEIVVPAGAPGTSASAQFALAPEDDMVDEADATLRVSGSVDGVTVAEAMLTLTDNDEAPAGIELSVSPDTVSEGAGETTVTVTATVAGGTRFGVDRTVTVAVAGSGKSGTVDFAEVADFPVTVPAGEESGTGTFVLRPEDDERDELDETVEVGGCLREAEVGECLDFEVTSAQVTVTDNDDLSLSVDHVRVLENAGEAVFTLKLSHPSERTIEVEATYMDGTARRGEDYRATERRVVFAKGETEGELRVALVDDSVMEEDEIFTVRFGPGEGSTELSAVLARCTIIDDDLIDGRRRKLEYALASFGRTVVQDLVTAVEERSWSAAAGTTATLAGMPLVSFRSEEGVYGALQRHVGPDGDLSGTAAWRELLSRSSFQLSLGDEGEGEADGSGADSLVLWGRGSRSWSAGRLDPAVATQGEVLSGQLGLELRVREDTLLGVMLSGSTGEVEFDGELNAEVETELVGVHPYAQWSPRQGLRMWAMVGYGAGEATLTDGFSARTGAGLETDIEMRMAAGGGSNEVASLWGVDWSVGTNGFFVQLDADEVRFDAEGQAALVPAVKSEVWQMRLLLEGSAGEDFGGISGLRGNVELAARADGGDAESGVGMEVGGGVGYGRADLGLEVEASGRVLLSHEEEGLEDAGVSLGLEFDPGAPGRGVYFALTPSWGNAASGARAVWEGRQASTGGPHGPDGRDLFDPQMRLNSELGYTTPAPTRHGTLTSYGAFSSGDGAARQYRIGRRLELAGIASMSVEAERRESAGAAPEHGIWLRGSIRY